MISIDLAKAFVTSFCNGSLDGISSVLAEDFNLNGPLFRFSSKDSYIESLKGNLEADPGSEIISITGTENEATVFYSYRGQLIAQLFRCSDGKINETVLVFDTSDNTLV
jgi:hypothetical protein